MYFVYLFIKVTTVAGFSSFTGHNGVVAKVIFLHLSVIHSVHGGGGLPQCMLGYHPQGADPPEQTPPTTAPWSRDPPEQTHPLRSRDPPGADTPPEQTPWEQTTPQEADSIIQSTSSRYASYWNAFLLSM